MDHGKQVARVKRTIQDIRKIWKSVTGYTVLINRIVIVWCSLSHKKFTRSVKEDQSSEILEVR